ncbi:response regulator [Methanobacterium sp. CWC-01]|jgi:CheY-like chemotaxis protein|uniref:response regulator n=1 Tax=Methanobacterium aridiramus TaxID=2584467 RepID=UPI0025791C29|nr:response regulator [Methanobacterium sp. CWC-01]WJI10118.1 response regulator [Methanobacterium sp. CWC-01]
MRYSAENPLGKMVEILLIEDNPGDIRLVKEVFKDAKLNNNLQVALDGEEAIKMLRQEGEYFKTPRPDLILLDLNLPKKNGREVLREIKEDDKLKCIPVVILTTSNAEEDLIETYKRDANCYITKPVDLDEFIKVVKSIQNFWLEIVKLPPR